jgi:cytochrome c oxidase assembly protein subunit 15
VAGLDAVCTLQQLAENGAEWFPPSRDARAVRPISSDNPIWSVRPRWLAWRGRGRGALAVQAWRRGLAAAATALVAAVLVQILLGIATILTSVELWIGVAHQGMAAILLGAIVVAAHRLGERRH